MKVCIIGAFGWYGWISEWVSYAFKDNGYEVTEVDRKSMQDIPVNQDLYVYTDCSEDYSSNMPDYGPSICWFGDVHMPGGADRSVNIARKCDLVFASNYEHGVKILEKFGIKAYLMPLTYSLDLLTQSTPDRFHGPIDFVMIGNDNSSQRRELWSLMDKYTSWHGRAETPTEYAEKMRSTQVVINQPTEPWDMILNNRFFEALGFEKVLFQKRLKTDLIEKLGFKDGKDFYYWSDLEELEVLMDKFVRRPQDFPPRYGGLIEYSMYSQVQKIMAITLSELWNKL